MRFFIGHWSVTDKINNANLILITYFRLAPKMSNKCPPMVIDNIFTLK